jgi:hypothetical protein
MAQITPLQRILLPLLWLIMTTATSANETVTATVVLVQATNGFQSLTGTAAAAALQTLAGGGLAGNSGETMPQDGTGVPAGSVGSTDDGNDGNEGTDSGSYNLSNGAIAGIAVGVGLLIIGICMFIASSVGVAYANTLQSSCGFFGSSRRSAAGRFASQSPAPHAA